ncbi:MAG: hypothetical protein AB1646_20400 [Thermodesulfobacteriota bacterium]
MNANVHYWIVCDAVRFIQREGSAYAKTAMAALQAAYGETVPVERISYYDGAVQNICGYVSFDADNFRDVAFVRGKMSGTTGSTPAHHNSPKWGFCGHNFATFNHFINAFVPSPLLWNGHNGYYFGWGSQCPEETFPMGFISAGLDLRLDADLSLVLDGVKPYWRGIPYWEWHKNLEVEVWSRVFPPVSSLARYYYTRLVQVETHGEHVITDREKGRKIAGLHLLGPVLHAIGDAVVPQHVRPALGFCHQAWENMVETLVCKEQITLDCRAVARLLREEQLFNRWCVWTTGPTANRFAEEFFVSRIAAMTRDRLCLTMGTSPKGLWEAGNEDWEFYMKSPAQWRPDAKYLYDLAVAGTVYAIVRAYQDLHDAGILAPQFLVRLRAALDDPGMHRFDARSGPRKEILCERTTPGFLTAVFGCLKIHEAHAKTDSERMALGIIGTEDGFAQVEGPEREPLLADFRAVMARSSFDGEVPGRWSESGVGTEDIRAFPGSRQFGVGSYRLPTEEECTKEDEIASYLEMLNLHHQQVFSIMKTAASVARTAGRSGDASEHPDLAELDGVEYLKSFFRDREGPPIEPAVVPDPFPVGPPRTDVAFRKLPAPLIERKP